jgi:hypothetical protein
VRVFIAGFFTGITVIAIFVNRVNARYEKEFRSRGLWVEGLHSD